ncbi:MAG: PIN domain-containing protein [Nitrospira sp.]|nr:PIN domain-containing protein [Nitrospira sp.]
MSGDCDSSANLQNIHGPPGACEQVDAWLESPKVILLSKTHDYWQLFRLAVIEGKVQGPLVHDARIAALCRHHGIQELWTADRDFS